MVSCVPQKFVFVGMRFIGRMKAKVLLDVSIQPYFRPFSVKLESLHAALVSGQIHGNVYELG